MTLAPNLILAGFQKCGSTFLARVLDSHPDIDLAEGKEPNLFLKGDESAYPARFAEVFREPDRRIRCDASINYLVSDAAMARAAAWCPAETRIVAVVRDPVERSLSAYLHLKKRLAERRGLAEILCGLPDSPEQVRSAELEGALQAMQAGDLDLFRQIDPHDERWVNALYVSNSLYSLHLDRLGQFFPPERTSVILFEDLVANPGAVIGSLLDPFGLSWRATADTAVRPSNRTVVPVDVPVAKRVPRGAGALTWLRRRVGRERSRRVTATDFPDDLRRRIYEITSPQSRRLFETLGRRFEGSAWDHE